MINGQKLVLVGAGLAGCLLAVHLAKRGYRVRVFEKRQDMRIHRIPAGRSINLSLSVRGIHALQEVGLYTRIEPELIAMPGRMLHDETGSLHYQPYGKNLGDVHYSVSRGSLNKLLLNAAEETGKVEIRFDQECVDLDPQARRLSVQDRVNGTTRRIDFDVAIGTDGAGSAVGRALSERGLIESSHERLAHGYKELTIPAAENGDYRLEKNALHIWPRGGFMLIALPNTDGSFTATLFLPHIGLNSFETLDSEHAVEEFFSVQFPDVSPLIPDLTSEYLSNPTGELGTLRCKPWHAGGTAMLLGDAAHAIVPFHGQGMNCAFEDCSALNRLLDTANSWPALLKKLEAARKPHADAIAGMALENYVEMRDSVRKPKFHLIKEIEWLLEERHPERFIARYSMVMFHRIPYAEAQRRGLIQAEILECLSQGIERIDDLDIETADRRVLERLEPIAPSY